MNNYAKVVEERARRFREIVLPHRDDAFKLAHYLMRNSTDAEDAVQECLARALRHFDSFRGPAVKPWLNAILRNVCNTEFAQRSKRHALADVPECALATAEPMWQETQATPESDLLVQQAGLVLREAIEALPAHLRQAIMLRDIDDLSYKDIAKIQAVPIGTVMSRLARARAALMQHGRTADGQSKPLLNLVLRKRR